MKPIYRRCCSVLCGILCILLAIAACPISVFAETDLPSGSSSAVTDTQTTDDFTDMESSQGAASTGTAGSSHPTDTPERIQAAYTFDDGADLISEVGGEYPLSTRQFGSSLVSDTAGYRNGGMKGYISLPKALFSSVDQFSMGFWNRLTLSEANSKSTLFLLNGKDGEVVELKLLSQGQTVSVQVSAYDGKNTALCTYDITALLSDTAAWNHLAFTYKLSGSVSLLTLYVNGKITASSMSTVLVDLSGLQTDTAAFHGVTLDELYFTDSALDSAQISSLMNNSVEKFYASENEGLGGGSGDTPDVNQPSVTAHNYTWAGYLFDGTFAAGTDQHDGDIPAVVDNSCVRIDSSKLKEKFGYAVIRREGTAPSYYLNLDSRLFNGHSAFTFTCWVYRNGKASSNDECLLDLNGKGTISFAPYAIDESGAPAAYIRFTDSRGNTQQKTIKDGKPADPSNKWVHYALTVSSAGDITVYIDGVYVETFSSGVNPATLTFSDCRVLTGASSSDGTRTAVDEVYVSPKTLSAAEIRKIHAYGLARYTTEVLPDPGAQGSGEVDPSDPNRPDATDIAEDAYSQVGVIANGFIGTTFDDRNNMGYDWNNGANASVTGGKLTQGVSSYGLSLDGTSSFIRYPSGILDGAEALTISLSYSWSGTTSATNRSQRLFDFSRKSSSVATPAAFIFLETGTGVSGLRFGISDGISSTYLTCDYNAVDTWTRVTVTISKGVVTLYINDAVAATGYTDVTLSSICPNFCYVGRSGVKGDPLFKGIVDEVYISSQALPADRVAAFIPGLSVAMNGTDVQKTDVWSILITVIIIAAAVLVVAVIAVIVIVILKKEKKLPEEEPPMPVPPPGFEVEDATPMGPRSARRARMEQGLDGEDIDLTVKFRKVSEETPAPADAEATATFRKITDGSSGSAPDADD